MNCKICDHLSSAIFSAPVLKKYEIGYYKCGACGFIQTDEPFWLSESYASAIADQDIGSINRAVQGSKYVEGLILSFFNHDGEFLDYGGGYGIFVRLMRDRGYKFYWRDAYCANLFAKRFEARPDQRFEMLTAFEVFEHLVNPLEEITTMLKLSENLAFSTSIVPPGSLSSWKDWWYFAPQLGQHISFFTVEALRIVAEKFSLNLSTDGQNLHLLSRKPVSRHWFRFVSGSRSSTGVARLLLRRKLRKSSLLLDDFRAGFDYELNDPRWDIEANKPPASPSRKRETEIRPTQGAGTPIETKP